MATSNRERIGNAMDLLRDGLLQPVARMLEGKYGPQWFEQYQMVYPGVRAATWESLDAQALLKLMSQAWNDVFGNVLGRSERSYVFELIDVRNAWAHQQQFSSSDTERALDTMARLLNAVAAVEQAEAIAEEREIVIRTQREEKARTAQRKATSAALSTQATAGYRPWREVITPHRDVQQGDFQLAEFAADLGQVSRGAGKNEYADPVEFFRRTYLTDGLQSLLRNALLRLGGKGGDPVIELKTNFGGGKTHSMLALYHLTSDIGLEKLLGLEGLLAEAKTAGVDLGVMPHRAVLVGTALSAGQVRHKDDGTEVHTLWGELAWQLGRRKGYALIAESDRAGLNPGTDLLVQLFDQFSPALILIDEWVAFIRQLYQQPATISGSFEANLSFAQSLTEAVRQSSGVLLVASLPSSDIETGGEGGREALNRLSNTFGRMQASWRPATTEEGFEIVRRRLFEPLEGQANFAARDAVIRAYMDMYAKNPGSFPATVREPDYRRRMEIAYPIHPELFDKLYNTWSTIDKFQRTRGVLRMMATVIQTLWQRNDASLLIMPATIPMDAHDVIEELTRYLDNAWKPVIESDVDGDRSLPLRLDAENGNFGRLSATRRVARTIYLGSAPTLSTANHGIEDREIILGSAQPGESIATFGDALRTLSDRATHLYVDRGRYWFNTQPSVARTAQDRAIGYHADDIYLEIAKRLQKQTKRGDFARLHILPSSSGDVRDEPTIGLVVLAPEFSHSRNQTDSKAIKAAAELLDRRSESPRLYRNSLVFAAADHGKFADLESAVRQYLAWNSIVTETKELNLDEHQKSQANTKVTDADKAVTSRIDETYRWVLIPRQDDPKHPGFEWEDAQTQGDGEIAERVSRRLRNDTVLYTEWNGTSLRHELDRIPLWRGDHVQVKQLVDDFAKYLYLPKLRDESVLRNAIAGGLNALLWETETFALADSYDEQQERYRGIVFGQHRVPMLDQLLVKPEIASRQWKEDNAPVDPDPHPDPSGGGGDANDGSDSGDGGQPPIAPNPDPPATKRRYHASVELDPKKLSADAGKISQEVLQHLAGLIGADVKVSLDIEVRVPNGIPDDVRRIVAENAHALKFHDSSFEEK